MTKCNNKFGKQYEQIICFGTVHNTHIKSEIDSQIAKLVNGKPSDIWKYDALTQMLMPSKHNDSILKSFKEPIPMINFYPTYPKHKNRKYDFTYHPNKSQKSILSQLYHVYQTNNKPISFCDRILYNSIDYFEQS
eukprot:16003_1